MTQHSWFRNKQKGRDCLLLKKDEKGFFVEKGELLRKEKEKIIFLGNFGLL